MITEQKKVSDIKVFQSFWDKSCGLIGEKEPFRILINTRFGIHTFGVKFPIDAVVLNANCIVRKIKKSLLPNRFFFWNPLYDRILELPQGDVSKLGIEEGQKLELSVSGNDQK